MTVRFIVVIFPAHVNRTALRKRVWKTRSVRSVPTFMTGLSGEALSDRSVRIDVLQMADEACLSGTRVDDVPTGQTLTLLRCLAEQHPVAVAVYGYRELCLTTNA